MADADEDPGTRRRAGKSAEAFRTIGEVSQELDLPLHVLRFWETRFPQVRPMRRGGGRRYYRPQDLVLLRRIRDLLYSDGYTISGVQKLLRENGAKALTEAAPAAETPPPEAPPHVVRGEAGTGGAARRAGGHAAGPGGTEGLIAATARRCAAPSPCL